MGQGMVIFPEGKHDRRGPDFLGPLIWHPDLLHGWILLNFGVTITSTSSVQGDLETFLSFMHINLRHGFLLKPWRTGRITSSGSDTSEDSALQRSGSHCWYPREVPQLHDALSKWQQAEILEIWRKHTTCSYRWKRILASFSNQSYQSSKRVFMSFPWGWQRYLTSMHPLIQAHWIGMIQKHHEAPAIFCSESWKNHWPLATWRRLDAPSCAVNQSLAEFGSAIFVNAPASPVAFLQLWSICSTWDFSEGINCCCLPSRPEAHRTWRGQLFWITILLNLYNLYNHCKEW